MPITGLVGERTTLLRQELTYVAVHNGDKYIFVTSNEINYYDPTVEDGNDEHVGWVFDLPKIGECGIQDPVIRDGVLLAVGTVPVPDICEAGGSSAFYQIGACSGGATGRPEFDVTGDGSGDGMMLLQTMVHLRA